MCEQATFHHVATLKAFVFGAAQLVFGHRTCPAEALVTVCAMPLHAGHRIAVGTRHMPWGVVPHGLPWFGELFLPPLGSFDAGCITALDTFWSLSPLFASSAWRVSACQGLVVSCAFVTTTASNSQHLFVHNAYFAIKQQTVAALPLGVVGGTTSATLGCPCFALFVSHPCFPGVSFSF